MQKVLILLLFICVTKLVTAQTTTLIRVDMSKTPVQKLAAAGLEVDHGEMYPGRFWLYQFTDEEITILDLLNVSYRKISTEDQELNTRSAPCNSSEIPNPPTPANFRLGKMGGYYQYEEMISILDSMHQLYPQLITEKLAIDTIRTEEGRPIYYLRISNQPEVDQNKPSVLFTALHHAREPMGLSQLIMFMWHLLEQYDKDPNIKNLIDNTELYFVPCVNPDGYLLNQINKPEGGGMWRKNKWHNPGGTLRGVDLNRNYGQHWGYDNYGSSNIENSATFRGTGPFSEPETQAIKFLSEKYLPNVALNYHTYGNYLVHPYGYADIVCPDDAVFKKIGAAYTLSNDFLIGNSFETVGYPTNGDSDDWMYDGISGHKIFSFTPEVGSAADGFWPAKNKILDLAKTTLASNVIFGKFAHGYYDYTLFNNGFISDINDNIIPFYIYKIGVNKGMEQIAFKVISNNATLEETNFNFDIEPATTYNNQLNLHPSINIKHGDKIKIEITKSMNTLTEKDTVTLTFVNFISGIDNHADDLNEIITNEWGITNTTYLSQGSCFTDSPEGNYPPNTINTMLWDHPIKLPLDTTYYLSYYAKWEIEKIFDYAQVFVLADGVQYPLCGKYSVIGGIFQPQEQPVYEGKQDWIKEIISLEAYKGKEIQIGFLMASDSLGTADGIYVDDISVFSPSSAKVSNKHKESLTWSLYPNPVKSGNFVKIHGAPDDAIFRIYDLRGNTIVTQNNFTTKNIIQIPEVHPGTYLLQMITAHGNTGIQQLIIQ